MFAHAQLSQRLNSSVFDVFLHSKEPSKCFKPAPFEEEKSKPIDLEANNVTSQNCIYYKF